MYVPKCTHSAMHMWSEDNFQDSVLFFHVGSHAWVVMLDMCIPSEPSYRPLQVLKGQSEKKAELSVNVAVISVWRRCCLQMILLMDAFINKVRVGAVLTPPPPHMLPH